MKLSIPKLHVPSPVLVIAGVLVIAAITVYGAARYEQVTVQTREQRAAEAAKQAQVVANLKSQLAQLQSTNTKLTSGHSALCNYIKSLETTKQTKAYVTTPTAGNCPNPQ